MHCSEVALSGYEKLLNCVTSVPCNIEYYASGVVSNMCSTWLVWIFFGVMYNLHIADCNRKTNACLFCGLMVSSQTGLCQCLTTCVSWKWSCHTEYLQEILLSWKCLKRVLFVALMSIIVGVRLHKLFWE